jgi:hypothetical protein
MKIKRVRHLPSGGQSIVEFALSLPILLILLSSLIEFGFALNEYLDLVDTARDVARFLSNRDPIEEHLSGGSDDRLQFYLDGVEEMRRSLEKAGWIELNPYSDDLVISVFALDGTDVVDRRPHSFYDDRCGGMSGGNLGWRYNCQLPSLFETHDSIQDRIGVLSASHIPPDTGIVLVEIFYNYEMKLGLPWVTGIVGDSILLHTYTFAPNAAAEP